MRKNYAQTRIMVEGALMIALSTVLSYVKVFSLPHGGDITLLSMLPILLMSYRNGTRWGLFTAFVHSLIQLIQGLNNLAYCQTLTAQIGCVLLDYLLAFTVLGLAQQISLPFRNRTIGIAMGSACACLLRFVCSFLSGYVVWKDYDYAFEWLNNFSWGAQITASMGENALCWFYSFAYNASYMLPETIITIIGAVLIFKAAPRLFKPE